MSDDEQPVQKKAPVKKSKSIMDDEDEPTGKASAALDNLLGGGPKKVAEKKREPTMLEKIMAGESVKKPGK